MFSCPQHIKISHGFGFLLYPWPEKKVKNTLRYCSVLGLAEQRAHIHSFSYLNFCAGATLRDQQQGAAETKGAGASECQLLANRGHGGCQCQHLWVMLAPSRTPSPDSTGLEPRNSWKTTAIATPEPFLSPLRYVLCVLGLSAMRGFGM